MYCSRRGHKWFNCPARLNREELPRWEYWKRCYHCEQNCKNKELNELDDQNMSSPPPRCGFCHVRGHTKEDRMRKAEIRLPNPPTTNFQQLQITNGDHQETDIQDTTLCVLSKKIDRPQQEFNWVGDTGATHHVVPTRQGFRTLRRATPDEAISTATNGIVKIEEWGTFEGLVTRNGIQHRITLTEVALVPSITCAIFSVTKVMDLGFEIHGQGRTFWLERGNLRLTFDIVLQSPKGRVNSMNFPPTYQRNNIAHSTPRRIDHQNTNTTTNLLSNPIENTVPLLLRPPKTINQTPERENKHTMDYNTYHSRMGHTFHSRLLATAKTNNITLTGDPMPCSHCQEAKAKRKPFLMTNATKATQPGERLHYDLSHPLDQSLGGSRYWALLVDQFSKYKITTFLKKKTELGDFIIKTIKQIQNQNMQVKFLRSDNAGENQTVQDLIIKNLPVHS